MEYLVTAFDFVNMSILFLQHLTGLNNFSKHLMHVGFKFLHHSAILRSPVCNSICVWNFQAFILSCNAVLLIITITFPFQNSFFNLLTYYSRDVYSDLRNQLYVFAYMSHHQVIADCCVPSISWLIFLQRCHSKVISDSNCSVFLKVVNIG